MVTFIRRLFGRPRPEDVATTPTGILEPTIEDAMEERDDASSDVAPSASCPSCGYLLQPAPARSRRCPSCRQQIHVRRIDGRSVLLADSAVPIFDRERQRSADEQRWTAERERWLGLAELVGAPANRRARLADAAPSEAAVDEARDLYMTNAERQVRSARTAKRWQRVARLRRQQAAELYRAAGAPVPPPESVIALHRDGMVAELRALASVSSVAELVSMGCCHVCRADDEKTFRIAAELRDPRLPHEGCTKGLCGCHWWLAMPAPKRVPKRRTADAPVRASASVASTDVDDVPNKPPDGDGGQRSIWRGLD